MPAYVARRRRQPHQDESQGASRDVQTYLRWCLGFMTVGAASLGFIGRVRHDYFMRYFDLSGSEFSKEAGWMLIYGYNGVVQWLIAAVDWFIGDWSRMAGVFVLCLFLLILVSMVFTLRRSVRTGRLKLPACIESVLEHLWYSGVVTTVVPILATVVALLMTIPVLLGEWSGDETARAELLAYDTKGCSALSQTSCVEVRLGEELLSQGLLLDGSSSHFAVFDTNLRRTRVFYRRGLEVRALNAPNVGQ